MIKEIRNILLCAAVAACPVRSVRGQDEYDDMETGRYGREQESFAGGADRTSPEFPAYRIDPGPGPDRDTITGLVNPGGPAMPRYEELPARAPARTAPNPAAGPEPPNEADREADFSRELTVRGLTPGESRRLIRVLEEETAQTSARLLGRGRTFVLRIASDPSAGGKRERMIRDYFAAQRRLMEGVPGG